MDEEYLTFTELAALIKVERETAWKMKERGVWTEGVHYVHPQGLGVRFKKSAILQWMEGGSLTAKRLKAAGGGGKVVEIKMAKGYSLGG